MTADIKYTDVDSQVSDILKKCFVTSFRNGYLKANDVVLPVYFQKFGQRILDMDIRDDDIWVCSFPKTGTTWTQEMVWCIANDLDFEGAKQFLPERFPFLDHTPLFDYEKVLPEKPDLKLPLYVSDSIEYINRMKSPRFIKSHLPYKLLPTKLRTQSTKAKIIYVSRNAKDTCLSYYHHCRLLEGYTGNFGDFCRLFLSDSLCFSPFFEHILGFWNCRDQDNLLFLKYEDMKQDLRSVIHQTAKFLGKNLADDQVLPLEDHLSFESMKKNRAVNYEPVVEINKTFKLIDADGSFMRSGTVGGGRENMPQEFLKLFDEWENKCLEKSGLKF
ncbi:luciferin sulfotransferase-like [Daktulosphaira vitifoliae]|uniref:luciferin sulfotransferase-like n=1 Tax=Daktulosphaira vitifoliae TaxID=58002 RepID=UPI0021AA33C9|nr:luciferin sulfotransferase-like [Daktulosphaira vitifoliae]